MPRNIFKWPCVMTSRGGVREVAQSGVMLEPRAEDKMSAGQSGGWDGGGVPGRGDERDRGSGRKRPQETLERQAGVLSGSHRGHNSHGGHLSLAGGRGATEGGWGGNHPPHFSVPGPEMLVPVDQAVLSKPCSPGLERLGTGKMNFTCVHIWR